MECLATNSSRAVSGRGWVTAVRVRRRDFFQTREESLLARESVSRTEGIQQLLEGLVNDLRLPLGNLFFRS